MRMHAAGVLGLGLILGAAAVGAACGSGDSNATDDGGADTSLPPGEGGGGPDMGPPDTAPLPSPFGLDTRPTNTTCLAPPRPPTDSAVIWKRVFPTVTLSSPMMMAQLPADKTRVFVAQRGGTIVSFPIANPPNGAPQTVLTIPNPVNTSVEGGFLGFAFHPKFAQNGRVFLSYTKNDPNVAGSGMVSVIARMDSADNGATFGNYTEIVSFNQTTAGNHKGGSIAFGADGFLYFGFGDGGGGGDTYVHGQFTNTYFGKIHRVDVDTPPQAGQTYVVPPNNPFASGGGQASTYAWGIRNPFRFSFDRTSGDLWLGDVGQNLWEEVDRIQAPGANLGWSCLEGTHDYASADPTRCPNPKANFLAPVFEYGHTNGASKAIIGGVVYRGATVPSMVGTYLFGDEVTGEIWALKYDPQTGVPSSVQLNTQGPNGNWVNFAEDDDGEVYALDIGGKIYVMAPAPTDAGTTASPFPDALSKTGCVDPKDPTKPAAGVIPYVVESPLWSDGAAKDRWLALPDGKTITIGADGHFDLPIGSVLMKLFALGGKRIETRLLVRHTDGGWAGYTYEWNDAQTDATLLAASKSKPVGAQTWYYPSRSDCFSCHSSAAQRTLGMELGQLNGDEVYPSTNRVSNQLATLNHIGFFNPPLTTPVTQIVAYPNPTSSSAPLDARARSYLNANCAICHRPNGSGGGPMDLRFATAFGNANACGVTPSNGDLGVSGALLIAPGAPAKSLVSLRPHALDATRMPPLATHVVDTAGLAVIDAWIQSIATCPPPVVGDAGGD